ncbi:hypothetical protein [Streptomyces sp. NPDC058295]|uniref:hypothetical protein n=1 Tax=Streptomyces sp. NPDC058295 TaxID=3346431 RepID=UPI0036E5DFE0
MESFDRRFPGFRSETHGVTLAPDTGDYLIECLRPAAGEEPSSDAQEPRTATPAPRSHPEETRIKGR